MNGVLPRLTLSSGAIIRWHMVLQDLPWLIEQGPVASVCLDVGCGSGEFVLEIARRYASVKQVVGIDRMERDAVGQFRPVPSSLESRVTLVEGRFSRQLASGFGTFDAVLCVDVLEHVPMDEEFLRDIASVVVPQGRLLVHVPARNQRHLFPGVWQRYLRQVEAGEDQHVREGYTGDELRGILRSSGWHVESATPTFGWIAAAWTDLDATVAEAGLFTAPIRCAALPLTIAGAWASPFIRRTSGNGWLVRARRVVEDDGPHVEASGHQARGDR